MDIKERIEKAKERLEAAKNAKTKAETATSLFIWQRDTIRCI